MRNLFTVSLLLISFAATAQNAKPFKVTLAGGYASPSDRSGDQSEGKPGFVYSIEPQYQLGKHLDVGVRLEQALIKRPEYIENLFSTPTKTKSILSAALTANYVVSANSKLRYYGGLGVGFYYAGESEQRYQLGSSVSSYPLPTTTNLGGLARVGLKFGPAHVEAAYNLIGDTSLTNGATRLTMTAKNSYFSLKAGITIGGSR